MSASGPSRLGRLRRRLGDRASGDHRAQAPPAGAQRPSGVRAENLIWMFGTARTGSTWLSAMLGDLEHMSLWDEPLVGELFGHFYYGRAAKTRLRRDGFVFSESRRPTWLKSIRAFVLAQTADRFAHLDPGDHVVIAEPNGSIGAPLLMDALPDSRMILLIRDPRDVAASALDAHLDGGWAWAVRQRDGRRTESVDPDEMVERTARKYTRFVGSAREAYERHAGHRVLVRYEELRADTIGTMRRILATLDVTFDEADLARVVARHAWENIPAEAKGRGKPQRKATPGAWREDLTAGQVKTVERITAELMEELYPA